MIRQARPGDLNYLDALAETFVNESPLSLTYDRESAREALWASIYDPYNIFLVDDEITGVVMGALEHDFTKEAIAYMTRLYVLPEKRGSGLAKQLLGAFEAEAYGKGAKVIFASANARIAEKRFEGMFLKYGYTALSPVLFKEIL